MSEPTPRDVLAAHAAAKGHEAEAAPIATWTVADACARQREVCARGLLPHFAPDDGVCYSCHRQIYEAPRGLDGSSFVTGCPWCFRSYCD